MNDNWLLRCDPAEFKRRHMERMNIKRTELAILKRYGKGEKPETSKALAKMMDRIYDTDLVATYHTKETK